MHGLKLATICFALTLPDMAMAAVDGKLGGTITTGELRVTGTITAPSNEVRVQNVQDITFSGEIGQQIAPQVTSLNICRLSGGSTVAIDITDVSGPNSPNVYSLTGTAAPYPELPFGVDFTLPGGTAIPMTSGRSFLAVVPASCTNPADKSQIRLTFPTTPTVGGSFTAFLHVTVAAQ